MNSKKQLENILFITTQMEARGTNEYVSYLAAELKRRGFRVAVFCAPGPMLEVLQSKGVEVETFKQLAGLRFPSQQRVLFREKLEAFSPDIIHAPSMKPLKTYCDIAVDYKAPLIVTFHAAPSGGRLFRAVAPNLSGIIATSQKVREEIVNDWKFPKNKITMICNGIDLEAINSCIARNSFSKSVPVLGSVGPVERARGHELFIEAAAIIMQSGKSAQFVVAGQGDEIPRLSRMATEAGLDRNLTFVRDFGSYHEVLDALDVVVQSAMVNVSGFSILDAMGSARPVVAFNTGTACEIIDDGNTGLVVPENDAKSLAATLARLVDNPEWARSLGEKGRSSVEQRFNIRETVRNVIEFYERVRS